MDKQTFKEFVDACINKLLIGSAALIVFYFFCKFIYNSLYVNSVYDRLADLLSMLS